MCAILYCRSVTLQVQKQTENPQSVIGNKELCFLRLFTVCAAKPLSSSPKVHGTQSVFAFCAGEMQQIAFKQDYRVHLISRVKCRRLRPMFQYLARRE